MVFKHFHPGNYSDLPDRLAIAAKQFNIVMVGDSVTRYQYLSMAYMLRYKKLLLPAIRPNLVEHHQWKTWDDFYAGGNALLKPFEFIDARVKDFENRYYNDNILTNTSLTYFTYFGGNLSGRWIPHNEINGTSNLKLLPTWYYELPKAIENIVIYIKPKPNILVLNCGLWINNCPFRDMKYFKSLYNTAINNFDIVIWKTTTAMRDHTFSSQVKEYDRKWCKQLKVICLDLSWTINLDSKLYYWDHVHFRAPVYWEIIKQLLDVLPTNSNYTSQFI